jgi:hypothetical protein
MSDKDLHIDKLFKDHLVGHKVKAPANAWERLSADLHTTKRKRPLWIWRSAAAALLLLVAFGAGYLLSEYKLQQEQITTTEPVIERTPGKTTAKPETLTQDDFSIAESTGDQVSDISDKPATDADALQKQKSDQAFAPDVAPVDRIERLLPEYIIPSHDKTLTAGLQKEESALPDSEPAIKSPDTDPAFADDKKPTEEIPAEEDFPLMDAETLRKMLEKDQDYAMDFDLLEKDHAISNWSIGARFSPVYSYRNLSGSDLVTANGTIEKNYFDAAEEGLLTLAGGISLNYQFNDRWSLGSGMYVSRIGQINNEVLAYASPESSGMFKLATSSGTVVINPRKFESVMVQQQVSAKDTISGGYIVLGDFVQNLDYLEVPLVVNYTLSDNRFAINLMGGLSPGILVNNRSFFAKDGEKLQTGTTQDVSPMIYNSVVGIGVNYSISEKVSINLEPTFKYSLSPVNTTGELNYHPYSLSWFTGISYKFY